MSADSVAPARRQETRNVCDAFRPGGSRPGLLAFAPCGLAGSLSHPISAISRSRAAAVSGVMSRCGVPNISYPTMNFRTVAERNSGG
jgi:hypothetical protein